MNELIVLNETRTMSSLEIAKLTGKNHADVMRDIRNVLIEVGIAESTFAGGYKDANNQERPCFNLPRRECDLVISGYSVKYRLAIIDRWHELEQAQSTPMPLTYKAALIELLAKVEIIEQLEAQALINAPAVAFVERFVTAKSSKCLSDVAKILGRKPQEFIAELALDGVIFKRGGSWVPSQCHIDNGRFTVHPGESSGHAYTQTRVEPKGIEWIAGKYGVRNLQC